MKKHVLTTLLMSAFFVGLSQQASANNWYNWTTHTGGTPPYTAWNNNKPTDPRFTTWGGWGVSGS